ncbi:helix-turn-helix domain-containing protein [Alteribacter aurantiacus]|uniref:helix-turn-helix domain-containing protein n=1 Tax=Alteribacter aurantiacus TaxID=254410 RepID=UPI0003FD3C74|nr:RodZ domain-containing protein [Alteribacter aurantiacus]
MSELGLRLKTAREERGLSLEELQIKTKIQKRYLLAIEEGAFDRLPGEFYVRAFVKNYADAVGLDPELLFVEHKDELPQPKKESSQLPPRTSRKKNNESNVKKVTKNSRFASLLPTFIVALIIILLIVVIWAFNLERPDSNAVPRESETPGDFDDSGAPIEEDEVEAMDESTSDEIDEEEITEENVEEPEIDEQEQEITVDSIEDRNTEVTLSGTDAFELQIVTTGANYMRIEIDGEVEEDTTFQNSVDLTYDLTDAESIFIRTGNAPGVSLFINGESFDFPLDASENDVQNLIINFEQD